ncbi:MAG: hypothetical protein QF815_01800 [Candidatus Peribacteraceae bacterium]|jgi:hypothetical protein|nr:hypothetical protein [Candidatus Peribacteraceae bacterium]MDP7477006.1 hypothetical protein [Candidatus Peribacteraceae bacterium]
MMIRKQTLLTALALVLLPQSAAAYLDPEQVVLNREMFMPPSARASQERTKIQFGESAARRDREQERAFALQHPVEEVPIEEPVMLSAPAMPPGGFYAYPMPMQGGAYGQPLFGAPSGMPTDTANLELLRTMRLLSRVNQNQVLSGFQQQQLLHSSADDLAPTGAGTVLAVMTMMGAVIYTMRKARASEKIVRTI